MTTRLRVNINDVTAASLRGLSEKKNTTVTEIVRRAVSLDKFLEDADLNGSTILLQDGHRSSIVLID